ncbi:hypothetical protein BTO10_15640 [Vibrio chagasii]|uniref:Uncharacterized protein n=1 Tax=Vibrio chagasii TaxID=170679 RepID=A0A2S7VF88_9VIBR|nr:hypothetical protein BTO10_15640 [Vibrio chagasii]
MKRQREITQQLITLRTTKPGMVCWHQNRQETTVYKVSLERKAAYFFIKPKIKDARAKRIKTKL